MTFTLPNHKTYVFAGLRYEIIFFEWWSHEIKNLANLLIQIHNKPLYWGIQRYSNFGMTHEQRNPKS